MKLLKLKKIIDVAYKKANGINVDIEFLLNDEQLALKDVGQFGVVPDVVMEFEK